jgi:hypothetical protein
MAPPCGGRGGALGFGAVCAKAGADASNAAAQSHARAGNRGLIALKSKPLPRGGKMARAVKDGVLALASLETRLGLVDHIDPAFAPDDLVVAVAAAQRLQRIADFHNNPVGSTFGRVLKDPSLPVKHRKNANKWLCSPPR